MSEPRRRPWHLYLLALVAVAIAVLAYGEIGAPSSSARTSRQVVTAQKGVVQSTVSGSGNVQAGTDLNVNFHTDGTLQHLYVTSGERVTKGQLLATLDPTSARLALKQAEKNLTAAKDQLRAAKKSSSSSTSSNASYSGSMSSTEYVSYTRIVRTRPRTHAHKPGTTTTTTTTTTQTSTTPRTTTTPRRTTTTTTTTPRTTPTPTTATPSTAASGSSTGSTAGGSSNTTSSAGTIASDTAAVYGAGASLKTAQTALAETRLFAPISGTIVSLSGLQPGDSVSAGSTSSASSNSSSSSSSSSTGSGGTSSGSGSSASSSGSSSSAFVEIDNTSRLSMTVAFSESDIAKIKVGQAATITLDALSGVELGAHVTQISPVGTTSNSVVSYDATLTLDQNDSRVKPGMSASASVIAGQAQGVTVPNGAVSGSGSLATVNVMRGGKTVQQPVVVGLKGDSRTQIVRGLKAGDQVVVTTTLPSLSSSSTSSSGSGSGTLGGGRAGFPGGGFPGGGFPGGGVPGG